MEDIHAVFSVLCVALAELVRTAVSMSAVAGRDPSFAARLAFAILYCITV